MQTRTGNGWLWGAAVLLWMPAAVLLLLSGRGGVPLWPGPVAAGVALLASIAGFVGLAQRSRTVAEMVADAARGVSRDLGEGVTGTTGTVAGDLVAIRDAAGSARERLKDAGLLAGSLGAVLEAIPATVLETDLAGVVRWANASAKEHFKGRGPEIVGRRIDELFTSAEVLRVHALAAGGTASGMDLRSPSSGGVRVFAITATPARSDLRPGVVLTLRDTTDLATAMQLRTEFVANASHELRTPLASIRGAIETLEGGAWEEPAMRERLARMIESNTVRLQDLVRDLLDLSRLESPEAPAERGRVRASEVAAGLRELLGPALAARSLTLEVSLDPRLEAMHTDPRLLNLILRNLLENAAKFAFEGTTVRLVGRLVGRADAGAGVRGDARWEVVDRGIGIPFEHQARVFERFFQVDAARTGMSTKRGTGLGLAIVKHAVRTLGGTIGVQSVWQQGTTMTVDLPACVEA